MRWDEQHPAIIQNDMIISCNEQKRSEEMLRPFILLKPSLSIDGDMWCCLYGENLQEGVAGFGKSPDLASRDFDRAWVEQLPGGERQ